MRNFEQVSLVYLIRRGQTQSRGWDFSPTHEATLYRKAHTLRRLVGLKSKPHRDGKTKGLELQPHNTTEITSPKIV